MFNKMVLPLSLVLLLLVVNVGAYQVPFYTTDDSFPSTLEAVSLQTDTPAIDCSAQFIDRASLTGSNFEFSVVLKSPEETQLLTGSDSNLDDFFNREIIRFTVDDDFSVANNTHEGKVDLLTTASGGNHTLQVNYDCDVGSFISFDSNVTRFDADSYTNMPNRLESIKKTVPVATNLSMVSRGNLANYNQNGVTFLQTSPVVVSGQADTTDHTAAFYYYFNSTNGAVNYSFALGGALNVNLECATVFTTGTGRIEFWLVNYEDGTSQMLEDTAEVSCNPSGSFVNTQFNGQLSGLQRDTIYYFMVYYVVDFGATVVGSSVIREPGSARYQVSAAPINISCGAFSACEGTSQFRNCEDTNGVITPFIEYRICDLTVLENATLGFENFTSSGDVLKCEPTWNLVCSHQISNVTLDRPAGWTINDPAYGDANFLQMTQEFATEGTRSLKMWQIPPKSGEVVNPTTCGNTTSSIVPQVFQGLSNDTFTVTHNVTFPAENMVISFDVKKCDSQVLQYSDLGFRLTFAGVNLTEQIFCPEKCYADSCDTVPNGRYAFNLIDTNTSISVFGVPQFEDAQLNTLSPTYDISNLGIIPGRVYNIVFGLSNENTNDASGNCVYFDNIQYEVTEENLLEFVPGCQSRCIGTRRIEARTTLSGSCFTTSQDPSPLCVDSATADAIENQENYCSGETTLQTFIPKTGNHEPITCSDDFVCSPFPHVLGETGSCISETEAEEDPNAPITGGEIAEELLTILVTRIGIAILAIVVLTLASAVGLGRLGAKNEMIPLAVGLSTAIGFIAFNWLPIEVGALIALVFAFLIISEYRKAK